MSIGLAGVNLTQGQVSASLVALGVELTTLAPVTILSYTPAANQALNIQATLTITAATTVTLAATWTDPNTGSQGYSWENGTNLPVEVRLELPLTIFAAAGGMVAITAMAGTINQVFVTAYLTQLR